MIEVKKDGVVKWLVNDYTFTEPQMGIRSINMTVKHPSMWVDGPAPSIADLKGAYVEYEGERYNISSSKPTAEKSNASIDYIYNIILKGEEDELTRRKVRNLAKAGIDNFISQGTIFSIYADINQFKQLLDNNLKYYFGSKWTINLAPVESERVFVDVNNIYVWDLLLKIYEYYGLRWFIRNKTIYIGHEPDVIQHVFDYGGDSGLVKITRTAPDTELINRLTGVGGSRNIPVNYFTNRYAGFPVDPNPINTVVDIKNLMPKVFRDSVKSGVLPYIDYVEDPDLVASEGVKEGSLEPNESIYPTIAETTVAGLGRIDEIVAVSDIVADNPNQDGYLPTFDIWLKDIGFDLASDIYTSTSSAKISFTTGDLAGYEFEIAINSQGVRAVVEDTSKSYNSVPSKYKVTLIKSSEEYDSAGQMLPNTVVKPVAGDKFVIYDIEMPQIYVERAEQKLQEWLESRLADLKTEKPTYNIEPIDAFFEQSVVEADGKTIKEKLRAGNKITVNNLNVTGGAQELHINNITIQYGGLYPKYSFVVTDKVQVSGTTVQRLENSIRSISQRQDSLQKDLGSNTYMTLREFSRWFRLDVLGNIYTTKSFYSTKGVSAYGLGTGGGGGTGYDRLDTWADYDSSKSGWVLSAFLGKDLDTRVGTNSASISDLSQRVEAIEGVDSDKNFVYTQGSPSDTWTISHPLNKYPSVTIIDSGGTEVIGNIEYIDTSTVVVTFASGFSGKAILN